MPGRIDRSNRPLPKPRSAELDVKASANDPVQKIKETSDNTFRISGTARNNGVVASTVWLELDGERVSIPLRRGMTPETTMRAIESALPRGYEMKAGFAADHPGGMVGFEIARKAARPAPAEPPSHPSDVARVIPEQQSSPMWYLRWKFQKRPPPASENGAWVIGRDYVVVKNGKVDNKSSSVFSTERGNVVVERGKIVGWEG